MAIRAPSEPKMDRNEKLLPYTKSPIGFHHLKIGLGAIQQFINPGKFVSPQRFF